MKKANSIVLLICLIAGFSACKKGSDTIKMEGGILHVPLVKQATISSGKNRVQLSWVLEPNASITKTIVYWNSGKDSLVVPVSGLDKTISIEINKINEGEHKFLIYNHSSKGSRSSALMLNAKVYGDVYTNSLVSAVIKSATLEEDGNAIIEWENIENLLGVEISYTKQDNQAQKIIVSTDAKTSYLKNFRPNSSFSYRCLYKPVNNLDTFFTASQSDISVIHKTQITGSVLERLRSNSSLVKRIISSSTKNSFSGFKETYVQFEDYKSRLQSVFIAEVDLNDEGLSVETGTPNDGNQYGASQTVSELISWKNKNSRNKKVVAAVNGDYFTVSSGNPLGPTIKGGIELMPFREGEYYYLGFLNNNLGVIGNKTNYIQNMSWLNEALGAFHLLVSNRSIKSQTDLSIAPRTTAGIIGSSRLIFVVADGRQSGYAEGLSLADMAEMHRAFGVKNAINLDGGGSSTFIVKDDLDQYKVMNKVSDGTERKVANAWLIMRSE